MRSPSCTAWTRRRKIQAYLDSIPYSPDDLNRTPLEVLHDRKAHCLDGALFAAAALRRIGHPALVVDMLPEPGLDDDHVLAIFRVDGLIGALGQVELHRPAFPRSDSPEPA